MKRKPAISVYFMALILGSGASFALSTYWLEFSPARIALPVGAVGGLIGSLLGENIGDAIIFSFFAGLILFFFVTFGPEIAIIRMVIVPLATGLCVGKLGYGIWKETST